MSWWSWNEGSYPSYQEVPWGEAGCSRVNCEELAILWSDDFGQLCADCGEEAMERQLALAAQPRMVREQLPDWNDR